MALNSLVAAAKKQQVQKTVFPSVQKENAETVHLKKDIIVADECACLEKEVSRSTSINAIVREIEASKKNRPTTLEGKSWENCKARKHCDTGKHVCMKYMGFCAMEKCNPKFMD